MSSLYEKDKERDEFKNFRVALKSILFAWPDYNMVRVDLTDRRFGIEGDVDEGSPLDGGEDDHHARSLIPRHQPSVEGLISVNARQLRLDVDALLEGLGVKRRQPCHLRLGGGWG